MANHVRRGLLSVLAITLAVIGGLVETVALGKARWRVVRYR